MTDSRTRVTLIWAALGILVAAAVMLELVAEKGGEWNALLRIGEDSSVHEAIVPDFDDPVLYGRTGHDGQATYVIARDPFGVDIAEGLDTPGYRYRRVLLSWLGGMFGSLSGTAAVLGISLVNILGAGMAAGAFADLNQRLGGAGWLPIAVVVNPGMLISLRLSTPDALAIGLSLVAVAAFFRRSHGLSVTAAALAALAKEAFLVVAFSLLVARFLARGRLDSTYLIPFIPLGLWNMYVLAAIGSATGSDALTWPFGGIAQSAQIWSMTPLVEQRMTYIALTLLAVAIFAAAAGRTVTKVLLIPWIAIGITASHGVWDLGYNAARVLTPLLPFIAIEVALQSSTRNHTSEGQVTPEHL